MLFDFIKISKLTFLLAFSDISNKTQAPKNSKLKQDTEKTQEKFQKTQIKATPVVLNRR